MMETIQLVTISAAINLIVGGVNIAVSLGLIWCARQNIKAAKLNRQTAEHLNTRL